ncbi:phosphotriesterase-related protein-like isoform X2 [Linepithema humile]|uniref:phosphotriesterase-related protein-like isoform X2 n=1 Tax=Linepithema humile TaxID=83485 RepID=UPI000623B00E|nr:PREDICTED: phosphotriesterase-related protein-like isoform X1 [Linepithema humile]
MMKIVKDVKFVETVTGPVLLDDLGITLTHEHLFSDFSNCFKRAPYSHELSRDHTKITLKGSGYLNLYPYSNMNNLKFLDKGKIISQSEILQFRQHDGKTIVENSNHGLRCFNMQDKYRNVSLKQNINIIIGTGYYVAQTQVGSTLNMSKENMYNVMCTELKKGIADREHYKTSLIKAGFIGEVGSSWPIHAFEKRSISTTGEVQEKLHCPVSFSPGSNASGSKASAPMEIMRIYQEAGGNARKAIMCHVDRTLTNEEQLMEFADDNKCYIQFSMFGTACSFYQHDPTAVILSDAERVEFIAKFKKESKLDQVLMSHDIHTKNRLAKYGGHGFGHIGQCIIPYMRESGFADEDITQLMVENPKNWLSWGQ